MRQLAKPDVSMETARGHATAYRVELKPTYERIELDIALPKVLVTKQHHVINMKKTYA